jgi:hypothetical protein
MLIFSITLKTIKHRRVLMGAILDVTEMLKTPAGATIGLAVVVVGYFFVKWVFAAHPEDDQ